MERLTPNSTLTESFDSPAFAAVLKSLENLRAEIPHETWDYTEPEWLSRLAKTVGLDIFSNVVENEIGRKWYLLSLLGTRRAPLVLSEFGLTVKFTPTDEPHVLDAFVTGIPTGVDDALDLVALKEGFTRVLPAKVVIRRIVFETTNLTVIPLTVGSRTHIKVGAITGPTVVKSYSEFPVNVGSKTIIINRNTDITPFTSSRGKIVGELDMVMNSSSKSIVVVRNNEVLN